LERLWPDSAGWTATTAAPPQNAADGGLRNPQFNRDLFLRKALIAQRLDLLN
jgi:hypothetical protein